MNCLYFITLITLIKSAITYNAYIKIKDSKQFNYTGIIRLMNEFYDESSQEYEGKLFKKHADLIIIAYNSSVDLTDKIANDKVKKQN